MNRFEMIGLFNGARRKAKRRWRKGRTGSERRANRIRLLHEHFNGECHWCGAQTDITPPRTRPLSAVVYHLDSKFDEDRGKHDGEVRTVLSCWSCANEISREREAAVPIEELWRRANSYPQEYTP